MKNFKSVVAAMHAKLSWKHTGHGKTPLHMLYSVGRRLTNVAFVCFALAFEEVVPKVMVPFTLMAQKAVEVQDIEGLANKTLKQLKEHAQALRDTEKMVRVATLIRQHVGPGDVVRLLAALRYTAAARLAPGVLRGIMEMIYKVPAKFQSCVLQTTESPDDSRQTLGPHCQCERRNQFLLRGGSRASLKANKAPLTLRSHATGRRVQVNVPLWTLDSKDVAGECSGPRAQIHSKSDKIMLPKPKAKPGDPPAVPFFRQHLTEYSRCMVPEGVYQVSNDISAALSHAVQMLEALHFEVSEMQGDVGVNDDMQRVLGLGLRAFDWHKVLLDRPTQQQCNDFLAFCKEMKPMLKETAWPEKEEFDVVRRALIIRDRVFLFCPKK